MQSTALTSTMTLGTLTITDRDTISGSEDITSAIAAAAAATGANLSSVQNAAVDAINSSQKLSFANKTDLLNNLGIAYAAASKAGTSVATFTTQIQVNMSSTIEPGAYGAFTNYSVNSLTNGTLGTQQSINSNVASAIGIAGEANGASLMSVYTAAVAVISAQSGSNNTAVLNQLSNALAYARTSSNTDNMSARSFSGALLTNFISASSGGTAGTPSTFANNYGGGITRTSATVVGSSSTAGTLLNVNTATTGQTNAQAAINAIDNALTEVNTASAVQGALQNRFTAVISNLSAFSQSQTAAKSRIVDADFAAETARLSKNQILQQAGTAMLAQANQIPSTVLSLLK
jgi:flagellin